ncbi:MAG: SDR family NAD(P)-dependent oxidoreductase [Candidatus Berkelbacteria bacterium]|nr:MAG: SDR family NAD(P)-dependent oxidoreductase [Candidatus Berkelbacteria bacterium]QQG51679.1 MAG: SDR family NAD(P)-dependent oxidoreductase [Candidatus Berkelbacteria bacterium]
MASNSKILKEHPEVGKLKGKKVVVTGGAGFIGSHLCEELVNLGADVTSIDDYSAGKERNLEFLKEAKNFRALKKDVTDQKDWEDIFGDADVVFHNAASKKNICLINPHRDLEVNAGGALNLMQQAMKYKVKKFVHASTGSVYGEPKVFPSNEEHPLVPVSYYGVSKLAGEKYVYAFHHLYGLNTTVLRYYHVYGTRQESNEFGGVVSIFLRNIIEGKPLTIFGDGTQQRSFTWVKDIVKANLLAAVTERSNGEAYNCASGIKVSIKELAENLVKMMKAPGVKIEYGDWLVGDVKYFDVDNSKIRDHLGLSFEKDFWGNMQKTIDEFLVYLEREKKLAAKTSKK